jgi:hypothetical protein
MQFISAKPLIKSFCDGTFQEEDVGPYFMAYVILAALVMGVTFGETNPWDVAAGIASIVITIFGVLHLKRQNGETFGNRFVLKYLALGWVVSVRMILISIPVTVVLLAFVTLLGGIKALHPMGAIFTIAYSVLFYWWLGLLIAESNIPNSEQVGSSNGG